MRGFPGGSVDKDPPAMQGTQAQSLVWENPTYHGPAKPVSHHWAHVPQLLKTVYQGPGPHQEKPRQWEACVLQQKSSPCSPQLEKACAKQCRPGAAINKQIKTLKKKVIFFKILKKNRWMNKQSVAYLYTGLKRMKYWHMLRQGWISK